MHITTILSVLAAATAAVARSPQHVGKTLPKPATLPNPRSLPRESISNSKRAPTNISAEASSMALLDVKLRMR